MDKDKRNEDAKTGDGGWEELKRGESEDGFANDHGDDDDDDEYECLSIRCEDSSRALRSSTSSLVGHLSIAKPPRRGFSCKSLIPRESLLARGISSDQSANSLFASSWARSERETRRTAPQPPLLLQAHNSLRGLHRREVRAVFS